MNSMTWVDVAVFFIGTGVGYFGMMWFFMWVERRPWK